MTIGVAVLGSTGSIGRSTLAVLTRHPERFRPVALTAHGSWDLVVEQAQRAGARFVGIVNGRVSGDAPAGLEVARGPEALIRAATHPDAAIVVNAIVGAAGLAATIAALEAGKRVALANKETLVMAGELVYRAAERGGGEIVPVDSEHSAVLQCVTGRRPTDLERLMLTASGGPFREWPEERVRTATVEQALQHPTWTMGPKITVDSATLANKALEIIEAHYLFRLPYDRIDVVVHPQSIVHAFAQFVDGSVLAQIGFPTMELPILYALTHPERCHDDAIPRFDPVAASPLTFEPLREEAFPAFVLGLDAGRAGGTAPTVFNAANEVAVHRVLAGALPFHGIAQVIARVLERHQPTSADSLEAVLAADQWARQEAERAC